MRFAIIRASLAPPRFNAVKVRRCRQCGTEVSRSARRCPTCGQPLSIVRGTQRS